MEEEELTMFENIDLKDFWNSHEYYTENYVEEPLTDEIIAFYENKLGFKLPKSYIQLMKIQNGGAPKKEYWFNEYAKKNEVNTIGLAGFFGIGGKKRNSLFGKFGNDFWFNEWEYPRDIGIITDTESGGHDMIYLDYRECGKDGEPKVSVCFQEYDYEVQVLANNFEEFIGMLISEEELE